MSFLRDEGFEETQKVESETTDETKVESITEEKAEPASEETQEEVKPQEDSEPKPESTEVPASFQKRIDELVYKYKSEREARLALEDKLKGQRENPSKPTSEEEVKEANAKEYLKNLYKEVVAEEQSKEQQEDKSLADELDHVSALYPDFNRKTVLETMDKFGIDNVEKAYLASKEMNRVVEQTKETTKKQILAKPKSPSSVKTQDGSGTKYSDDDIRGKSIYELAEMAKKEAGIN